MPMRLIGLDTGPRAYPGTARIGMQVLAITVLAFVYFDVCLNVAAVQLTGTVNDYYSVNGGAVINQDTLYTFQAEDGDAGIPFPYTDVVNGVSNSVVLTFGAQYSIMQPQTRGYLPADGQPTYVLQLVFDGTVVNATTVTGIPLDPMGRKLQSIKGVPLDRAGRPIQGIFGPIENWQPAAGSRTLNGLFQSNNPVDAVTCAAGTIFSWIPGVGNSVSCGGWVSQGQLQATVSTIQSEINATVSWEQNATAQFQDVNTEFSNVNATIAAQSAYNQANTNLTGQLATAVAAQATWQLQFINQSTANANAMEERINATNFNVLTLSDEIKTIVQAQNASQVNFYAALNQFVANSSATDVQLQQAIITNAQLTMSKFQTIAQDFIQVAAIMKSGFGKYSLRNGLAKSIQTLLVAIRELGQMVPFFDDLGTPLPNYNGQPVSQWGQVMDTATYQYMWTADTNGNPAPTGYPMVAITRLVYKCNVVTLLTTPQTPQTLHDIALSLYGGYNCSTTVYNASCPCWMEVQDTVARMKPYSGDGTGATPDPTAFSTWQSLKDTQDYSPVIPIAITLNGATSIIPGSLNGMILRQSGDYLVYDSLLCARGARSDFNFYRTYSATNQFTVDSTYSTAPCTMSLADTFEPGANGPFSVSYTVLNYFVLATGSIISTLSYKRAFGSIPNGVAWKPVPFLDTQWGTAIEAMQGTFMNFPPQDTTDPTWSMLPVSQLIETQGPTVQVSVAINGGSATVYNGVPNDPNTRPASGTVVVGNPYLCWTTAIYNIDQSLLPISPVAEADCGRVTYNMYDDYRQFTPYHFLEMYNSSYDHSCGKNVPAPYLQSVDPATGQCTTQASLGTPGTWCNSILTNYQFVEDSAHSQIKVISRHALPSVTVRLPTGVFIRDIVTGCPAYNLLYSQTAINVEFSNNGATAITFKLQQQGGCQIVYDDFSVGAYGQNTKSIAYCAVQLPGVNNTLAVISISNTTNVTNLIPCAVIDLAGSPLDPGILKGSATWGSVQSSVGASIDISSAMATLLQNQATITALQTLGNQYTLNVTIAGQPQEALIDYNAQFDGIVAANTAIQQQYEINKDAVFNTTDLQNTIIQQSAASSAAMAALLAQMKYQQQLVINGSAQISGGLVKLQNDQIDLTQRLNASVTANANANAFFNGMFSSGNGNGVSGGGFDFGGIGSDIGGFFTTIGGDIGSAASGIAGIFGGVLGGAAGTLLSPIIQIVEIVAIVGAIAGVCYLLYKHCTSSSNSNSGSGTGSGPAGDFVSQRKYRDDMADANERIDKLQKTIRDLRDGLNETRRAVNSLTVKARSPLEGIELQHRAANDDDDLRRMPTGSSVRDSLLPSNHGSSGPFPSA